MIFRMVMTKPERNADTISHEKTTGTQFETRPPNADCANQILAITMIPIKDNAKSFEGIGPALQSRVRLHIYQSHWKYPLT
jgi:hypothetical protein